MLVSHWSLLKHIYSLNVSLDVSVGIISFFLLGLPCSKFHQTEKTDRIFFPSYTVQTSQRPKEPTDCWLFRVSSVSELTGVLQRALCCQPHRLVYLNLLYKRWAYGLYGRLHGDGRLTACSMPGGWICTGPKGVNNLSTFDLRVNTSRTGLLLPVQTNRSFLYFKWI